MSIQAKSYMSENLKLEHELQVSAQVSLVNPATSTWNAMLLHTVSCTRGMYSDHLFFQLVNSS